MEFGQRSRILFLGGLWGVLQGSLLGTWPFGVSPCSGCGTRDFFMMSAVVFNLLIVLGVATLAGFILDDFRSTVYALVISQTISGAFFALSPLEPLFLIGMGVFLFPAGLLLGVGGAYFREWVYPRQKFRIAWTLAITGLALQTMIIAISLWLFRSLVIQGDQFSGTRFLALVMAIFLASGLSMGLFGIVIKGYTSSSPAGGLAIASVVIGGLTIISINFVGWVLRIWGNSSGPNQNTVMLQFGILNWTLYVGLVVPTLVFLRIVFSK